MSAMMLTPGRLLRPLALVLLCLLLPLGALSAEQIHILKQGETLFRVSRTYDVPVDVLQRFNAIADPQRLKVGTQIRVPGSYKVQKGDTLYGIARRFSVELSELLRLNGMSEREVLRAGRTLFLPTGAAVAAGEPKENGARGSAGAANAADQTGRDRGGQYWPLSGNREPLQGRILGTVIYGQTGQPVVSVSSGRVIWAGPYRGFSRVVLIEGNNGYTYVYAGNEETLVRVGDTVRQGSEIGRLGKNVHQGTAQLYFLVYHNGTPVDPSQAPRG
jgi:murein DD-endopeptidase MepM/ murein hydrolase activator NlpD